jgi:hypothetical protein
MSEGKSFFEIAIIPLVVAANWKSFVCIQNYVTIPHKKWQFFILTVIFHDSQSYGFNYGNVFGILT